ncbi:MAG: fumarylacetoacetase [Bacteroidia bacterium]
MIATNNPSLTSWVQVPADSDFPIQNLPFGIFSTEGTSPRAASAIGDYVVDLAVLAHAGVFHSLGIDPGVFSQSVLNDFIALGQPAWRAVRQHISHLLQSDNPRLRDDAQLREMALIPRADATMHMPVFVRDYTDFYASEDHARNIGTMFRDPENALLPNWKHLPVGYHGRASSIVVSGTPITRPSGQTRPSDTEPPVFGPTRLLDFELEMGIVVGKENKMGQPVAVTDAENHIFGMQIFNDWSARDIQKWEYVPLGPFLAKNFASSVSPWIVTLDALEPFRTDTPKKDPEVLPYLQLEGKHNFDINLEVLIQAPDQEPLTVSKSNSKFLYWSFAQQLAHHTISGCNLNVGDMMASGTISGPTPDSYGSMLEISWRGTKPVSMPDGSERKFILDGDTVIMRAFAEKDGVRIGFGEVSGEIFAARK